MILGRNVDNVLCTRMTTLSSLVLGLSPFVIFDSNYALILCPLCKLDTLWNIFMILSRNLEQPGQDDMSCTSMTTLTFLLLKLSPFVLFLKLIPCPHCNSNTLWNILMVFDRNVD